MPIPTEGQWPPRHVAPAYSAYQDWDAWYVGDPEGLRRIYASRTDDLASRRTRPSQYSGGMFGRLSRWLWGAPLPPNTLDSRLHVPLAADLAATAAGLLFSEPPSLTAPSTGTDPADKKQINKAAQQRIEYMVEDGLHSWLRHAAEAASTLGDVYLRPVIDPEVSPARAIATAVDADGAIPVIRWGRLVEVTFWTELENDGDHKCLRLLEHHDVVKGAGRIQYALYEGSITTLGSQVPLSAHPDAKYLAGLVDSTGAQATKLDRLDVIRVPNAGPQRRWRKTPGLKYLGRSDLDGNEPIFDKVDYVWTSWMRDIHLGRGRITVPDYMLRSQGPGQGAVFDADREVYSAVNASPTAQGASAVGIAVSQFNIRHVEHKATLDSLVEAAMRHAGLSSQTLGEEGDVAMTATEAQGRERMSYITRGDRQATWGPGTVSYIELHTTFEKVHGLADAVEPFRPLLEWSDGVAESPESTARTIQMLAAAEALSVDTKVRMVHPDWEDTEVDAEVARIKEDTAPPPLEDPGSFTGGPPSGGDKPKGPPPDGK